MNIAIKTGDITPEQRGRGLRHRVGPLTEALRNLQAGQYIEVTGDEQQRRNAGSQAYITAKREGFKVTTRRVDGTLRIYRVDEAVTATAPAPVSDATDPFFGRRPSETSNPARRANLILRKWGIKANVSGGDKGWFWIEVPGNAKTTLRTKQRLDIFVEEAVRLTLENQEQVAA